MRRLVRLAVVLAFALAGGLVPAAHAGRHLLFGVADDTLKWTPDPLPFLADAHDISSAGPHARVRGAVAPGLWYRRVGDALRASHRRRPIFDTVGHNAYPDSPFEGPWTTHDGPSIDQGDYAKLLAALRTA